MKWVTLLWLIILMTISCENLTSTGAMIYDVRLYNSTSNECTVTYHNEYGTACAFIKSYRSKRLDIADFDDGRSGYIIIDNLKKDITKDCDLTYTGGMIR